MNAAVKNESVPANACPDSESLAAYSDRTLDAQSRAAVEQHLAGCPKCLDELVALDEARQALVLEPANVARPRFGKGVIASLAAAAAVAAVLFGVPAIRERVLGGNAMAPLVKAAGQQPNRSLAGRLSAAVPYKAYDSPDRGKTSLQPASMELAALTVIARTEKSQDVEDVHARGIARLFLKEYQLAIAELEAAAKAAPNSPAILNDLAAAYIAAGQYKRAHATATKAWSLEQSPTAAWNIAQALHDDNQDAAAIAAWQKYLTLDSTSEWAAEARSNIAQIEELRRLLP